jgi:hypothetical protein
MFPSSARALRILRAGIEGRGHDESDRLSRERRHGGRAAARVDDPRQGGHLQSRELLPRSPELAELLDDMDANGVERAILLTKIDKSGRAPTAQRFACERPDRFSLGVGGFNLLRPMPRCAASHRSCATTRSSTPSSGRASGATACTRPATRSTTRSTRSAASLTCRCA